MKAQLVFSKIITIHGKRYLMRLKYFQHKTAIIPIIVKG